MSKISEEILASVDIIDIINTYVPLKRAGANFTACCPFHNEKTPSFMVSPSKQIFKCFGCGKGGNVITFVQEIERIDFWDAAKELAKKANIDVSKYQKDPQRESERQDEKEKIKRIHKITQKFFVAQLQTSPEAKKYLKETRKLDDKALQDFGVGYAPDSHYALIQELKKKGFKEQDMIDATLAKKSTSGGDAYSFFRNRITFPIYDTMNNIIGFSARILNPDDKPKYLNSAEHKAFQKSQVLYGLNRAKTAIREYDALCIVEGQMDVIGLAKIGYPIGVATCGTALTAEHLKTIKRFTENIFLLFDNDEAGQEASTRALSLAYQHDIFPKIIHLPETVKDIDDLANTTHGKKQFEEQRAASQDGLMVTFERLKKKFDLSSPIDKQKILNILFGLILNIHSSAMQDHYIQAIGEKIGIRYEIMRTQYVQYAKKEGKFILQQRNKTKETKYEIHREAIIAALLHKGHIQQYIENAAKREGLTTLIEHVINLLPNNTIQTTINDPEQQNNINELQLRREKELTDKEEEQKYQTIKQIILPTIQHYIQKITKEKNISSEQKQNILNLIKKI